MSGGNRQRGLMCLHKRPIIQQFSLVGLRPLECLAYHAGRQRSSKGGSGDLSRLPLPAVPRRRGWARRGALASRVAGMTAGACGVLVPGDSVGMSR